MGREIKRVALDFDWPIGRIWAGYKLSLCEALNEDCDLCRKFAAIQKLPMADYDCPEMQELEPPSGEGWQLWETVSEGSPVSPVFATPEELATWLSTPGNLSNNDITRTNSYETWVKFITGDGWAPTLVSENGNLMNGVEAMTKEAKR